MKPTSPEIIRIANLCLEYEAACMTLETVIADLEERIRHTKDETMPNLKRAAAKVASFEAQLQEEITDHPDLFRKPKTLTLHGVRVGYLEAPGKLEIDDEGTAITKLRTILGHEDADQYIATKETLRKDLVRDLDPKVLARLGARVVGAGDQVIIRRSAGEIEKLLNKMVSKLVEAMSSAEA